MEQLLVRLVHVNREVAEPLVEGFVEEIGAVVEREQVEDKKARFFSSVRSRHCAHYQLAVDDCAPVEGLHIVGHGEVHAVAWEEPVVVFAVDQVLDFPSFFVDRQVEEVANAVGFFADIVAFFRVPLAARKP